MVGLLHDDEINKSSCIDLTESEPEFELPITQVSSTDKPSGVTTTPIHDGTRQAKRKSDDYNTEPVDDRLYDPQVSPPQDLPVPAHVRRAVEEVGKTRTSDTST